MCRKRGASRPGIVVFAAARASVAVVSVNANSTFFALRMGAVFSLVVLELPTESFGFSATIVRVKMNCIFGTRFSAWHSKRMAALLCCNAAR